MLSLMHLPIELRAHIAIFHKDCALILYKYDVEFHDYIHKHKLIINNCARLFREMVTHKNRIFILLFGQLHSICGEPAVIGIDNAEYWCRGRIYKKIIGGDVIHFA